jgi:hypothetical protein
MLDAIMSPDWEYRYYFFDSKWGLSEMMASMRNGQGDDFTSVKTAIKINMGCFIRLYVWKRRPGHKSASIFTPN